MGAPVEAPSRRRRHAALIATAAELVGECAQAAAAVYGPIADAPPEQEGVRVSLWPVAALAAGAPVRLDAAAIRDEERFPAPTAREDAEGRTTFRRRCALAEAESTLLDAQTGTGGTGEGAVPLPTAEQTAAMGLTAAGADFLEALEGPEDALALLAHLTRTGEYTAGEILDEATHTALVAALLIMQDAARERDPSTAAERCLHAARQLALVVIAASLDPRTGPVADTPHPPRRHRRRPEPAGPAPTRARYRGRAGHPAHPLRDDSPTASADRRPRGPRPQRTRRHPSGDALRGVGDDALRTAGSGPRPPGPRPPSNPSTRCAAAGLAAAGRPGEGCGQMPRSRTGRGRSGGCGRYPAPEVRCSRTPPYWGRVTPVAACTAGPCSGRSSGRFGETSRFGVSGSESR